MGEFWNLPNPKREGRTPLSEKFPNLGNPLSKPSENPGVGPRRKKLKEKENPPNKGILTGFGETPKFNGG